MGKTPFNIVVERNIIVLVFSLLIAQCNQNSSLKELVDFSAIKSNNCENNFKVIPPNSLDPSTLSPPKLFLSTALLRNGESLPILQAERDPLADLVFYEICAADGITCRQGLLFNHQKIEFMRSMKKIRFMARSCVWGDRSHKKSLENRFKSPIKPHKYLYCSPKQSIEDYAQGNEISAETRRDIRDLQEARSQFHTKIYQFYDVLSSYKFKSLSPLPQIIEQINRIEFLRDNIHSLILSNIFNHNLYFSFIYLLKQKANTPGKKSVFKKIECSFGEKVEKMQGLPPSNPFYVGQRREDTWRQIAKMDPITYEEILIKSTAFAVLAIGEISYSSKISKEYYEQFRNGIAYIKLNKLLNSGVYSPVNSHLGPPIFFGIGLSSEIETFRTVERTYQDKYRDFSLLEDELEFYESLLSWAKDFYLLRQKYLDLRKKFEIL